MSNQGHTQLIDKFYSGSFTDKELAEFEQSLIRNPELSKEFHQHNIANSILIDNQLKELKPRLAGLNYRKLDRLIWFNANKWYLFTALSTALIVSSISYIVFNPESKNHSNLEISKNVGEIQSRQKTPVPSISITTNIPSSNNVIEKKIQEKEVKTNSVTNNSTKNFEATIEVIDTKHLENTGTIKVNHNGKSENIRYVLRDMKKGELMPSLDNLPKGKYRLRIKDGETTLATFNNISVNRIKTKNNNMSVYFNIGHEEGEITITEETSGKIIKQYPYSKGWPNYWDGHDANGIEVPIGYYLANVVGKNKEFAMKIVKLPNKKLKKKRRMTDEEYKSLNSQITNNQQKAKSID